VRLSWPHLRLLISLVRFFSVIASLIEKSKKLFFLTYWSCNLFSTFCFVLDNYLIWKRVHLFLIYNLNLMNFFELVRSKRRIVSKLWGTSSRRVFSLGSFLYSTTVSRLVLFFNVIIVHIKIMLLVLKYSTHLLSLLIACGVEAILKVIFLIAAFMRLSFTLFLSWVFWRELTLVK